MAMSRARGEAGMPVLSVWAITCSWQLRSNKRMWKFKMLEDGARHKSKHRGSYQSVHVSSCVNIMK